ncbi:MAG: phosphatidic acid phosphatase [Dehalococcoidales bacterium]|nr:phosphatidic acid phosphatase [Dehalococcoidales bacterium]
MSEIKPGGTPQTPPDRRQRLAILISNIFSPFFISVALVFLVALRSTRDTIDALRWSLVALALSILPIFITILYLVRSERLESMFINVRRQRHRIYLLSGLCAAASCVILFLLEAPLPIVVSFLAALTTILVFGGINIWWKISVHTAFAASSITVLILLYGYIAAVALVLLPAIGWSRIELEHHSPLQVAAGAILAAGITVGVFSLFGMTGAITA